VTCPRDAGLSEMGRLMATHHIHSLVVWLGEPGRWGVVSDLDIALAAVGRREATAENLAPPATGIPDQASLMGAIELMRELHSSHLIVIETASGHPIGILSALDIVAWGEA
jgi:CBS domain-containing protein